MTDGWRCPNCGACYSPFVQQCFNCRGAFATVFTASPPACLNCGQPVTPNHRCVVSNLVGAVLKGEPQ